MLGLRLTAPAGEIALPPRPASAAGPDLRGLLVGSEGTLGVIGELALRVRAAPRERCYEGVFFADFTAGVSALRTLAQEHAAPAVARLSDEAETRMSLAQAGAGGLKERARTRLPRRCAATARGAWRSSASRARPEEVARGSARRALELVRSHGGLPWDARPGEAWRRQRFAAPYLRDELLTHGVMVETLETATQLVERCGALHRERARRSPGAARAGHAGAW